MNLCDAVQEAGRNVHRCYLRAAHDSHECVCGRRWIDHPTREERR